MNKKIFFILLFSIFIAAVVIFFTSYSFEQSTFVQIKPNPPLQKIHLAHPKDFPNYHLVIVAKEKGFFDEAGLDVQLVPFPSGTRAISDGLYPDNEINFAISAQIPIIFGILNEKDLKVIATLGESNSNAQIISKKDSGVFLPSDIIGKKIATQRGSSVHYFLDSFLLHNNISVNDVDIIFQKIEKMPLQLYDDKIDAFSSRDPFTSNALDLIGEENITIFNNPGNFMKTYHIVTNSEEIAKNPEIIDALTRGLLKANDFVVEHPDEFKIISSNHLSDKHDASDLDEFVFYVSLEQSLLMDFEEKSQWAISTGLTKTKKVPNLLDYFYLDGMKEHAPENITVIETEK